MPPEETRRAARAAAEPTVTAQQGGSSEKWRTGQRRRRGLIVLAAVVIVLLALTAWLAYRALTVGNDLTDARTAVSAVSDGGDIAQSFGTIAQKSESAAAAAADPVWRVAEFIPWAGDNLRGVRLAAEALDVIANDIGVPILAMQADGEGAILGRALPVVESGARALRPVTESLVEIAGSSSLVGPVRDGVDEIATVLESTQPVLDMLPALLGSESPKNYLLVFQNNAESLPLGGSAASQSLVSASAGDLEITAQASSGSFGEKQPVDFAVSESAAALYGSILGKRVNMSTTQPDWPTAAQMVVAFWNRDIDDTQIDGVISIDPVALSRVLVATGPITVGDIVIDSSNAVSILLSDVYEMWDAYTPSGALASDAFFASTASQMFEKVASGDFDLKDMAWAVNESVAQGSILAWMADEGLQSTLERSGRISGILPTANDEQTTLGVFFRDVSASKIDYYMDSETDATLTCSGGSATLAVKTTLHLDIDQAAADALPRYVKSFRNGSTYFSTQIYLYAPPGMTVSETTVDGNWVETFREGNVDFGRVVAPFQMRMAPGETVTVTATFTGDGEFGPLDVWTTPTVRGTEITVADSCG